MKRSTVGSGVGAFLAPRRKKTVKKTFLKKPSAKNVAVKLETRPSVFAKAGMLSARELTRHIAECSELAKKKEDEELAEGVPRPELGATVEDNTQHFAGVAGSDVATRAGAVSTSSARLWRAARTICLRRSSCWFCWPSCRGAACSGWAEGDLLPAGGAWAGASS